MPITHFQPIRDFLDAIETDERRLRDLFEMEAADDAAQGHDSFVVVAVNASKLGVLLILEAADGKFANVPRTGDSLAAKRFVKSRRMGA